MKTKAELCALRNEVEALNRKLAELSEEELKQVCGGMGDHAAAFGSPVLPAVGRDGEGWEEPKYIFG